MVCLRSWKAAKEGKRDEVRKAGRGHRRSASDQELWEASVEFKAGRGLLCFELIVGHWSL